MQNKNFNASEMGKLSHQKRPRSKEFYSMIGKKGNKIRWSKIAVETKLDRQQAEYMAERAKQDLPEW